MLYFQSLLLKPEMRCDKHNQLREYLNLAEFIQDDKLQLICKACNYNELNQIKLSDLEQYLAGFNDEINWLRPELTKVKMSLIAAKKVIKSLEMIEQNLNQIERIFQEKANFNLTIQNSLKDLDYRKFIQLLNLLKQKQLDEQKILQKKCFCENEIKLNDEYSQAINVFIKANDDVNEILKQNQIRGTIITPQTEIIKVDKFEKQVEQDFDKDIQVYDMQMNKTGQFLAVGSSKIENENCYAYIWEIRGGLLKKAYPIKGHEREVKTLFFNTDDTLFTGSIDSTIKIWVKQQNAKIWDLQQNLDSHKLSVNCIQLYQESFQYNFASGSEELIIWKRDITKNNKWVEDVVFKDNTRIIQTLSFGSKGNTLMVGSDDRLILIYEYQYKKWLLKYQQKQENKIRFIFSTFDQDFISYLIDGQYKLWKGQYKNNQLEWEQFKGKEEGQIKKLSFSQGKKILGISYEDQTNKIFQIQLDGSKKELYQKKGDLLILSYLSPSKHERRTNQFYQSDFRFGTFLKIQTKFAMIQNGKLEVYAEDIEID